MPWKSIEKCCGTRWHGEVDAFRVPRGFSSESLESIRHSSCLAQCVHEYIAMFSCCRIAYCFLTSCYQKVFFPIEVVNFSEHNPMHLISKSPHGEHNISISLGTCRSCRSCSMWMSVLVDPVPSVIATHCWTEAVHWHLRVDPHLTFTFINIDN